MAKKLIKNYVFNPGLGINENARPSAVELVTLNKVFIQKEISAYIQAQIDAGNTDYTGKTYDLAKCERDAGYVIDALIFDLRYNGNEETRRISGYYWDGDVPQIQGNRVAEIESYTYAKTLINTYILTNTSAPNPYQTLAVQYTDSDLTTESGTTARVTTLLDDVIDVISGGLDSLPSLTIGLGRIELLGKLQLEELLVITNVTDNEVIYNFADPSSGGTVKFNAGNTEAYPQAFSINEGTTVINFKHTTSSMSSTDDIQIFVEDKAQKVQMADINTDAMERIKVAIPQAMLDADFEYGLQPTKWQAIATERGYPSTYEIPASDIPVTSVTTDASSGSSGVGASLITVTTQAPHALELDDVITIRALASSVIGFNRAEGTFIINSVPSTTTFTYYAKSKVGNTNGEVLATGTTQLRRADFYTGANISNPRFSVPTQGGSGSFTLALDAPLNATNLTFVGNAPPNGIVLSGTDIPTGTQVSGTFGGNNVNGVETTAYVADDFTSGSTIELVSTTGISQGMIVSDDGTINGTQSVITSISNNVLTLDRPVTANYTGDRQSYTGIVLSSANYVTGTGTSATFDVNDVAGVYEAAVNAGGSGYEVGDTLLILGTALGGTSPASDLYLLVENVTELGAVTQVGILQQAGTVVAGTYTGVASSQTSPPNISNASVSVTKFSGTYEDSAAITTGGSGFGTGMKFTVAGTSLGGATPANDATITVEADEIGGAVFGYGATGTSARGDQINIYGGVAISQGSDAPLSSGATITYSGVATIQATFGEAHGLLPGSAIMIGVTSDDGSNNHALANGPYYVNSVPNLTTIQYIARTAGTVDVTTDNIEGSVYVRPDAFFSHRPYDGGVELGTGSPQHGNQAIRMSKKYIRYQSGKGVMYNTGALFAPSFDIRSLTSTGTTVGSVITVATDDSDHGLQSGATVRISGCQTVGYDGDYVVSSIVDERTFRVVATTALGGTTGSLGSQCQVSTLYWHGAVVRSGCFDDQNGIFWQYDGQQMAVGRRTSTFQCAGTIAVDRDGNSITGTNTRFRDQLQAGDRIVIKGMTHVVTDISSNTAMNISPGFRGVVNITGTKVSKVQDLIIPQNEWNIDRCDGTGPSGYEIDVTKMQMIGIQFTWYGAGFIDWMLRGPDGNYIFCHRLKGNNLNTEAYMRTGNTPVRYEVLNESARSKLAANINSTVTDIELDDTKDFPQSGTVYIAPEVISYTSKNDTTNTLSGCTRAASLTNFAGGSSRTYTGAAASSHTAQDGVILISGTTSPIISHWGSAYLLDGKFDDDRGYIFSYPAVGLDLSTTRQTAFLIRLAPSVSNAVTGDLGERELLNRAQLLLDSVSIASEANASGALVIEGVINPQNYPSNPNGIQWNGLNNPTAGGQPSFAQIALGSSVAWEGGGSSTTTTATIAGQLSASFTCVLPADDSRYNNDIQSGRDRFFLTDSDAATSGIEVGDDVGNNSFFPSGTFIESIETNWNSDSGNVTRYNTSQDANTTVSNATITVVKDKTAASYSGSNTLPFTSTSWTASGASQGTRVSQTEFPSNTLVGSVTLKNIGSTNYYLVTFSQSFSGTLNAAGTVEFDFTQPPYAQPGETVFSFITNPGENATLSLKELKELTTTAIGGRGTFPNGPDVLAINVYKTSGTNTVGNVLLRWSEAQA